MFDSPIWGNLRFSLLPFVSHLVAHLNIVTKSSDHRFDWDAAAVRGVLCRRGIPLIIIGSASPTTHEKGVLREVNPITRAINWLFGAASAFMVSLSGILIATPNNCADFSLVFTGFRLLSHLSHRRQLWFGCFAAELRTPGIVLNKSPAPP